MIAVENLRDSIAYLRNPKDALLGALWGRSSAAVRRMLKENFGYSDADIDRMVSSGIDYADLKGLVNKAMTDKKFQQAYIDVAQAVQKLTGRTNLFNESILDRPVWMNGRTARMFMTFLSYSRALGNTLSLGMREARQGNLAPLVTLLVGGAIGGALVDELKDILFNKKDEPIKDAWDLFKRLIHWELEAATFGLWGVAASDVFWSIRLQKPMPVDIPLVEWWWRNVYGIGKAIKKGDATEAYKEFARTTPIVRAIDSHVGGPLFESRNKSTRQRRPRRARRSRRASR